MSEQEEPSRPVADVLREGQIAMAHRESEHPMPLTERCQECLCPLCHDDSRCPACHGQGIGDEVRAIIGEQSGTACPKCEPDNPAARYADTCVIHRAQDGLPAHYFDCDSFQTYNYGLRSGTCDCTATADMEALLALAEAGEQRG